jgi:hypothetical protein
MVRTQIQLTQEQYEKLKRIAAERGVSTASLIRTGVDHVLRTYSTVDREELKRRALAASGSWRSGVSDLSTRHDEYLAQPEPNDE